MKLNKFEAICLILIITIVEIILSMPEYLTKNVGTGAIINILYISIIGIFLCFIICKIFKNFPSSDILDISEFLGGSFLKFILSFLFIFFLLLSISIAISNFTHLIKSLYFKNYSALFIMLFFIAILAFSSMKRIWCN